MKENNQTQISAHIKMKKDIMKNSFTSKLTKQFFLYLDPGKTVVISSIF